MVASAQAVSIYDDSAGWPNATVEKEHAFRQGFLEEASRVVREWTNPDDATFDPFGEEQAALHLRLRTKERYTIYRPGYGPNCAGRKTHHVGYWPGHEAPAARLRGRHHALAYVTQSWDDVQDFDAFDRLVLPAWLAAVERWAQEPIKMGLTIAPPRPLSIVRPDDDIAAKPAASDNLPSTPSPPPAAPAVRPLKLTRADEIEMRRPDWLLRGMLERDTFALIFGDPGCGKTFLAIDWACRIATGTAWRGHDVKAGPVVYVAGEGQQGFGRRIRAWGEHNGVSLADAPLYVAPAVAIPDVSELTRLVLAVQPLPKPPAMIVLDTLARCFGGGDENSTQDMSKFVSACDALRRHYGCTVLVVHHTGHADKNRARGAIALKAALDAEYRLVKDDKLLLTATKMKDAEMPVPVAMELVTVELPGLLDDYDNPVASAAVNVLDADVSAIISKVGSSGNRGKWQQLGLEVARRLVADGDDGQASVKDWHDECEKVGMRQSTRYHVLTKLHAQGALAVSGDTLVTA
ncbi:MAG: AAA family ATPase [Phycisphaerae bacterium]